MKAQTSRASSTSQHMSPSTMCTHKQKVQRNEELKKRLQQQQNIQKNTAL